MNDPHPHGMRVIDRRSLDPSSPTTPRQAMQLSPPQRQLVALSGVKPIDVGAAVRGAHSPFARATFHENPLTVIPDPRTVQLELREQRFPLTRR